MPVWIGVIGERPSELMLFRGHGREFRLSPTLKLFPARRLDRKEIEKSTLRIDRLGMG